MSNELTIFKGGSPVEIRRGMLKEPGMLADFSPVERRVFMASTAKTFEEYRDTDLAQDLERTLKYIFVDIGVREMDKSGMGYLVVRLCEILKVHYPGLTMKDFRMAFEMSVMGALDDYLRKGRDGQADRGHYQQFNAEYVCKILNAYKGYRGAVLQRAYDMIPEPEPGRDPGREREAMNSVKLDCIGVYEYFKENGFLPPISPIAQMLYYNLLADAGLAEEITVTAEEQMEVYRRAVADYAQDGAIWDMNRLKMEGPGAGELQGGAFIIARRKALEKAFRNMVEKGVQIADYIKLAK